MPETPNHDGPQPPDAALPALQRALRAHRTLSAGNRTLLRATDEMQLLRDMCAVAVEQGGYVRAGVVYADKGPARRQHWMVCMGMEGGKAVKFDVRQLNEAGYTWDDTALGQDTMGIAIRTREPFTRQNVLSGPVFANPRYELLRRLAEQAKFLSLTAFPLICDDDVVGALFMAAPEPDAFDQQEIDLLSELAADLAYGIHTLRIRRAHRKAEETIARLSFFDQLTGLPNRTGLLQHLRAGIEAAHGTRRPLALLHIGVDGFHDICNVLGYGACDTVMQVLGQRLASTLPDGALVTTPGDGEFGVVLQDCNVEDARAAARTVLDRLGKPIEASAALIDTRLAIGIAVFSEHAEDAESLARRASAAMHVARTERNGISVHSARQEKATANRLAVMGRLRRAIEFGEFELYCQPKVEIGNCRPCGAEALLRWRDPVHGLIGPGSFIPLAEQGGLITSITDWLLEAAFQQVHAWRAAGKDYSLSVNLSAHDLHDPALVGRIRHLGATWDIPADAIQFELTESALMIDPEAVLKSLRRLKDLGFGIWIDDFGTGYSSLSYLQRFPIDAIKIDQSFVRPMTAQLDSSVIVRATIELGHNLGLEVIAEGVEDREVWASLEAQGCDVAQGFFLAQPMPVDQYMGWASEWRGRTW
jgi:diguanylate cyclase (GGDEF)-like protein